jgi:hypothetical protein
MQLLVRSRQTVGTRVGNVTLVGTGKASDDAIDWRTTMTGISCPVLLAPATGEHDCVAPATAWTAALLPHDATVHRFARSGHTPFVEEDGAFVEVTARRLHR